MKASVMQIVYFLNDNTLCEQTDLSACGYSKQCQVLLCDRPFYETEPLMRQFLGCWWAGLALSVLYYYTAISLPMYVVFSCCMQL